MWSRSVIQFSCKKCFVFTKEYMTSWEQTILHILSFYRYMYYKNYLSKCRTQRKLSHVWKQKERKMTFLAVKHVIALQPYMYTCTWIVCCWFILVKAHLHRRICKNYWIFSSVISVWPKDQLTALFVNILSHLTECLGNH